MAQFTDKKEYDKVMLAIDELPKHPIAVFAEQIPGNSTLPLKRGVQYANPIRRMGDLETLPQAVLDVIESIKAAEPIPDKALIAHNFANSYIVAENQFSEELERDIRFAALANDPRGDCDDYASFKRDLLLLGGMNS